jgi:hypothetical protein
MRRKRNCAWIGFFLLVGAMAQAQSVKVEYDPKVDFTPYKTYSWMKLSATNHPFVQEDVVGAIDLQLKAKGLTKVDSGGDLLVNAYGSLDEGINVAYAVDGYALPNVDSPITWAYGVPVSATSTSVYVDKGTLVVDLADRRAKQLKWRATAKAKLDPDQHEKSLEIIEKAVVKMFRDYPKHH